MRAEDLPHVVERGAEVVGIILGELIGIEIHNELHEVVHAVFKLRARDTLRVGKAAADHVADNIPHDRLRLTDQNRSSRLTGPGRLSDPGIDERWHTPFVGGGRIFIEVQKRKSVEVRLSAAHVLRLRAEWTEKFMFDGELVTLEQFIKILFGRIPDFFSSKQDLRVQWSDPKTREALLQKLGADLAIKDQYRKTAADYWDR